MRNKNIIKNIANQDLAFFFPRQQYFQLLFHYMHINAMYNMCFVLDLANDTLFLSHDKPKIDYNCLS